jgi:outer membrane protein assembly factor BamB/ABC-type phosphate/phosphonate transport system substrate-binding protein
MKIQMLRFALAWSVWRAIGRGRAAARPYRFALAWGVWLTIGLATSGMARDTSASAASKEPIVLVAMDPLARELACACVRGYAQRDYHLLAAYLSKKAGQRVVVRFSDDLTNSIAHLDPGQEAIVVAKCSVVEHDAAGAGFKYRALCRLTGKDGSTLLTGYFVAKAGDTATKIEDVAGRRVLLGSPDADEKYSAALQALKAAGVPAPKVIETRGACSDAAIDVVDSTEKPPPVGLISSYALPLLNGCGTIKKGDLKVIGQTRAVPFVTVFCSVGMSAEKQQKILEGLLAITNSPKLMKAMETKNGFVPLDGSTPAPRSKADWQDWPGWRGADRDGHVPQLPDRLPEKARVLWQKPAMNGGLAGITVAQGRVIVADRDPADGRDVFRCLDASDGRLIWLVDYEARGQLDYGQFPRATPVIHDGRVYLLGALGALHCVRLENGKILWHRHLVKDLGGKLPTWGCCATPLVVDDLLIVNPGGPKASVAALDCKTGRTRWVAPGHPAAYSSFISGTLGGKFQIVGYDKVSLGGWDPKSGERLWTLTPPVEGDFNVPTPLAVDGKLLVATENNGTRLYGFGDDGKILAAPLAQCADLAPATATPIATNGRVFGCHAGIDCLDLRDHLKPIWHEQNDAMGDHAALFASPDRVLVVTLSGELFLLSAGGRTCEVLSKVRLFEGDAEIYSHPALANNHLYIRGPASICCMDLGGG